MGAEEGVGCGPRSLAPALRQAVWIVLAACAAGFLTYRLHPFAPQLTLSEEEAGPPEITLSKAARWGQDEVVWVDTRTDAEFEDGHVPGAVLLRVESWDKDLFRVFDRLQQTGRAVVYEAGAFGEESAEVAKRLRDLGIREVYVLRGDWRQAELR